MKKSIFSKVGAAAVVLTLVTASLVGGTFAKYTTTVNGTATATAAKWSIALEKGDAALSDAFTMNLANENTSITTTDNKLAPGASGKIELSIDGTGSEIGYHYSVKANGSNLKGLPIVFYTNKDDKAGSTVNISTGEVEITKGDVELSKVGTAVPVVIYWEWDPTSEAADDTPLGVAGTAGTITLSVTAEQLVATTPAS